MSAPHRYLALDSWRGICALLVAAYHFHFHVASHLLDTTLTQSAWMFVDFFFALSGFVMTAAYPPARLQGQGEAARFLIRRVGRLWPLHVALLAALLAFELVKSLAESRLGLHFGRPAFDAHAAPAAIIPHLLLIQSLGPFDPATWNTPSWSISTEFYAYVLFAVLALATGSRFPWAAAGPLVAVSAALLLILPAPWQPMLRCIYGFMLGSLAAALTRRVPNWPARGLLPELAALAAVAAVLQAPAAIATLVAPPVFALAVTIFAREPGPISRLLRAGPFLYLGRISYSIYMVHIPLLLIAFDRLQRWIFARFGQPGPVAYTDRLGETHPILAGNPLLGDGVLLLYLLAVVALATVTYRTIEQPCRRRVARWTEPPRSPAPEPSITSAAA